MVRLNNVPIGSAPSPGATGRVLPALAALARPGPRRRQCRGEEKVAPPAAQWFRALSGALLGLIVLASASGCQDYGPCPLIEDGDFMPEYAGEPPNCDDFIPYGIPLEYNDTHRSKHYLHNFDNLLATEAFFDGCEVRVWQALERDGATVFALEGQFWIMNENQLAGSVVRRSYDASGAVSCAGVYPVMLTKRGWKPESDESESDGVEVSF